MIKLTKLLVILLVINSMNAFSAIKTEVKELICEYHTNPLGIDIQKPRLSWQITSSEENLLQMAYEIKVTDQTANGKLIWTSGKVNSPQSVNVVYLGPALRSMQRVYWQVRVWDNKNKATKWSEPAYWEMGILEPESWKANWITIQSETTEKGSKPAQFFMKDFAT